MELSTFLHMIRLDLFKSLLFSASLVLVVSILLCPLFFIWVRADRIKGVMRSVLRVLMILAGIGIVLGVMGGASVGQSTYHHGKIEAILATGDAGRSILYYARLRYGEADDTERYRLIRYDGAGVEQARVELLSAEDRDLDEVWHVQTGDRLFFAADGELSVYNLSATTLELSHAQLIAKQPALAAPIKLLASDEHALWVADRGGLRYRIDGATLEARRAAPNDLPSPPDAPPLTGCLDQVRLGTSAVRDAPQRRTIMRAKKDLPGDGWINPVIIQEDGLSCALQLVPGELFLLSEDSLDGGMYRAARVGEAIKWDVALSPPWLVKYDPIIFMARHKQQVILVSGAGRIGALELERGALAWSIDDAQLARWWGDGGEVKVRGVKLDGDVLDLWVSEEDVTLHHVRRRADDGQLVSSVGF